MTTLVASGALRMKLVVHPTTSFHLPNSLLRPSSLSKRMKSQNPLQKNKPHSHRRKLIALWHLPKTLRHLRSESLANLDRGKLRVGLC